MFKYNNQLDRFVPDRHRDPYSFSSISNSLIHQCFGTSEHGNFLEPFECERLKEQQHRVFRQLQSYMSLEYNGGHLLRYIGVHGYDGHQQFVIDSQVDYNVTWPLRVVRERQLARKSYCATRKLSADLLLDMPNLSSDWMTKILDWSSTGYLTAAIESSIHLWSSRTQSVRYTINATIESDESAKTVITCLKWDSLGEKLAYSFMIDLQDSGDDTTMTIDTTVSHSDMSAEMNVSPSFTTVPLEDVAIAENNMNIPANQPNLNDSTVSETMVTSTDPVKKTNYIKVWLLNKQKNGSNYEKKSAMCGCATFNSCVDINFNECCVIVMDWMANNRILVTGCTRATVTFFRYDCLQKELITIRVIPRCNLYTPTLISCLHVSQDKFSRHLAFTTYSPRTCMLKVFRIEDPPEYLRRHKGYAVDSNTIHVTETLTDKYNNKLGVLKRIIKAFAWHPWKHSLMCYAVVPIIKDPLLVCSSSGNSSPTWYVLADACKGQVLRRVEQTTCNSCPMVRILHINTHAMTFSHITGELLVSATTVYNVQKHSKANSSSCVNIVKKHSIVVMHALNRIVETLSSSETDKGLFFAWSPDGSRIALTSTEESLRIWDFWPTTADRKKIMCNHHSGYLNNGRERNKNNYCDRFSHMSELSFDASRIIK